MVSHRNVKHFVEAVVQRYQITKRDRLSQTFDMTFDLSAFDMFVAWECGACVCCPSQRTLLNPGRFIEESLLSVWFSVPSVAVFMKRLGMLKRSQYPNLRWSLFCGEPLPADLAEAWSEAAPNSIVENLYGPTEVTIACTAYRWNPCSSPAEVQRGLVPIGEPLPGLDALIAREDLCEAGPLEEGELLISGPQVSLGYWRDQERTAAVFVMPPQKENIYYRTGDLVRRVDGYGPMVYLGRADHQIKVRGYRVELEEVEAHLRAEAGTEVAVAVGWPLTLSGADGIVAFLDQSNLGVTQLRQKLKAKLPPYAVPREIRFLSEIPVNENGKTDRKALIKLLQESK
jgi:non-ribosomal peptide synthetase component F